MGEITRTAYGLDAWAPCRNPALAVTRSSVACFARVGHGGVAASPRRLVPGVGSVLTPDAFNNGGERHRGLIPGSAHTFLLW